MEGPASVEVGPFLLAAWRGVQKKSETLSRPSVPPPPMFLRPALCSAVALLAYGAPRLAAADTALYSAISTNDHQDPAIAYNSNADQYFLVFTNAFGTLQGAILDADGTEIDFLSDLLPGSVARNPRITYRPGDDQYVLATAVTGGLGEEVVVRGLDADGNGLWIHTPGFAGSIETPDVMADTFPTCCTLVTWKQNSGAIHGQRYNAAGTPQGGSFAVVADSGTTGPRAYGARIAYKRMPGDDFVVVWELARNNQPGLIQARVVEPLSGALGPVLDLAQTDARPWARLGERFPGGVDIAYDETQDHFYVAWRDETEVMLHRAPASLSGGFDSIVFSETPGTWGLQGGTPEVVVAEGYGKIYVSHPVSFANLFGSGSDGYFVNGAWFTATGSFGWSPLSTAWSDQAYDNVVGGFSPVMDDVFGVFERDRPVTPPGLDDLWMSFDDVP